VGQLGVADAGVGLLMAAAFRAVCSREWAFGRARPSITFAITAPFIMMVGGTYPFLAEVASRAAGAGAVQRRPAGLVRPRGAGHARLQPAVVLAAMRGAAGVQLGKAQPLGALRSKPRALGMVLAVFVVGVLLQRAFPSLGWYHVRPLGTR
jgi:hypothetical protein